MAGLNRPVRAADTWALGRRTYEAIVPWWDQVAAGELAALERRDGRDILLSCGPATLAPWPPRPA
jgi:hypothetical protein